MEGQHEQCMPKANSNSSIWCRLHISRKPQSPLCEYYCSRTAAVCCLSYHAPFTAAIPFTQFSFLLVNWWFFFVAAASMKKMKLNEDIRWRGSEPHCRWINDKECEHGIFERTDDRINPITHTYLHPESVHWVCCHRTANDCNVSAKCCWNYLWNAVKLQFVIILK